MVALEHGEPLLLYIATTSKVMSMVLVIERLEPQQLQVPKGALAMGYVSQDSYPIGGSRDKEALGS
jgi:hypothetical protein